MEDNGEHLKNEGNIFRPIGLAGSLTPEFAPRLVGREARAHTDLGERGSGRGGLSDKQAAAMSL